MKDFRIAVALFGGFDNPLSDHFADNRGQPHRVGWIVVGSKTHECLIADVSGSGAGLVTDAEQDTPLSFDLLLTRSGSVKRQCFVVRKSKSQIGVQFINQGPVGTH